MTKEDAKLILKLAHRTAAGAVAGVQDGGACGFAWVTIPGTDPLARACRALAKAKPGNRSYGSKGYPTGWQWWSPGYNGQSIDAKEKAAYAFRDVLATHGIRASVWSRLD